jgi:hypothetical protein
MLNNVISIIEFCETDQSHKYLGRKIKYEGNQMIRNRGNLTPETLFLNILRAQESISPAYEA